MDDNNNLMKKTLGLCLTIMNGDPYLGLWPSHAKPQQMLAWVLICFHELTELLVIPHLGGAFMTFGLWKLGCCAIFQNTIDLMLQYAINKLLEGSIEKLGRNYSKCSTSACVLLSSYRDLVMLSKSKHVGLAISTVEGMVPNIYRRLLPAWALLCLIINLSVKSG